MKIVGIIAEYNPFHNGHEYHIEQAKTLTQADAAIVIMSGDFVQRGEPAIMPKHLRAEAALRAGASLVIELPVYYATQSAELFAFGAVSILEKLNVVDALCFGSEAGNIQVLSDIADILTHETPAFKARLQEYLRMGDSFPTARKKIMKDLFPDKDYDQILESPNNILGIEYLKALSRLNSEIIPYTIPRCGSAYHDDCLDDNYSSATAIRKAMETEAFEKLSKYIPSSAFTIMQNAYNKSLPIYANDFSLLLKYRLLNETKESLSEYADVTEDLANRIYKHRNDFESFDQFCLLLKTKELTYTRISRALIHILLKCKKNMPTGVEYARVLGFRTDSTEVMSQIKKCSHIPLVTKLSAFEHPDLEQDVYASHIYQSVIADKYKTPFQNEFEHPIVRI